MMGAKITPKMLEALRAMQGGATLIECRGLAWLVQDGSAKTLNYRTYRALWDGVWIGRGRLRSAPIVYIHSIPASTTRALEAL